MEDDTIWDSGAYQFLITNLSNSASPNDSKLKLTILYILDSLFKVNNDILLYICETGDGLQEMRNRLFRFWFGIYKDREEYLFLPQTVYDEEGNDNYAALIIRKDNPQFRDLVTEFMNTVNLLNSKPEH